MNQQPISTFNKYLYYGVIVIVSLVVLFFFPMLGSEVGLAWNLPNTAAGWIIWSLGNLASAGLNLLIFHAFVKQGKVNILFHPSYLAAEQLLCTHKITSAAIPLSPQILLSREYHKKGVSLVIFTLIGTIGLSNALLTFNAVRFLTQLISLVVALIFGVIEMKTVEEIWTIKYLTYAEYQVQEKTLKETAAAEALAQQQTTHFQEITEVTIREVTREIPNPTQKENKNDNNSK